MVGYLSFLKVGPQLLKFIPGEKARDLRSWLTVYSYWNQGGLQNVVQVRPLPAASAGHRDASTCSALLAAVLTARSQECAVLPLPPPRALDLCPPP